MFCFKSKLLGSIKSVIHQELKSMIAQYKTVTISNYNLVYEAANFSKDNK